MADPTGPSRRGRGRGRGRALRVSERAYRSLLRAYPGAFRREYGGEMARCFRDLCREALDTGGGLGLAALWAGVLPDLLATAARERGTAMAGNAYRVAVGLALAAAVALVWGSLGMGIIGADGDPANAMYVGVLAVGVVGAVVARFRPLGMARALCAMAVAQVVVAVIALALGLGAEASPPVEILGLTAGYAAMFVGSALLFRYAGRGTPPAGVPSAD